jgi:ribosomal protein S27AE
VRDSPAATVDLDWPEEGRLPGLTYTDFDRPTVAEPAAKKRFCSRCGEPAIDPPAGEAAPTYEQRVCGVCGMGVLLRCSVDALPGANAPFLIVTRKLDIAALSEAAEAIFGAEEKVIGKALLPDLITSTIGDRKLARAVSQAALRVHEPLILPVRLSDDRADSVGTMGCRISTCGPPRAALLSLEQTHFGRG